MKNLTHGRDDFTTGLKDEYKKYQMTYFLDRIAKHLYDHLGGALKDHCLVFPNRRAGLYFLKYLGERIDKPVWSPAVMTINEFFGCLSGLQKAENETLLCELYKVYRKLNMSAGSFDEFYFWGDMLINDFDDVDKYMADARILYRNVQDFKNIDSQFGDIDNDQAEIIKRFWRNFEPEKPSTEKAEFRLLWSILYELYSEFRTSLRKKNLAYEGMIFREVAERANSEKKIEFKWQMVHFVGFNALNKCEEALMQFLQKSGLGKFYWDYDISYIKGGKLNSAGLFLAKNLDLFHNDMPDDWNYNTSLSSAGLDADRKIIETTSDIAQVKLIPRLVCDLPGITSKNAHHTAVILADENLLVPVLTSLPENIGDINISMGYPLKLTSVYVLVKYLLNLQRNITSGKDSFFYNYRDVLNVLRHQLIVPLLPDSDKDLVEEIIGKNLTRIPGEFIMRSERLKEIFRRDTTPAELSEHIRSLLLLVSDIRDNAETDPEPSGMNKRLENEFIYRVLLAVNRLETIIRSDEIGLKTDTYIRILDKILRSQSVPFSGEPLSGIQIMGILETRCLDFENVIILSVNEGVLPAITSASSFIPFSIREAFGLPTINHQESIFAYHFYRLLHRAEKVTLVYNSNSDGLRTGEMSRFIIQMIYEKIIKPGILNLSFDIINPGSVREVIERTAAHSDRLNSLYDINCGESVLSPTAINAWLSCRMKFYYRYISGLKEPETISEEIDHALFGRILHRIMHKVYERFQGKQVDPGYPDSLIKNDSFLNQLIDEAFTSEYMAGMSHSPDGQELIIRDILHMYVLRILKADRSIAPFSITSLEKSLIFNISFKSGNRTWDIRAGGIADRIDWYSGKTRIVDYKTGSISRKINSVEDLFTEDRKRELDGWLQTVMYCEAFVSENPDAIVKPSVYKIRELSGKNFNDSLKLCNGSNQEANLEDYNEIRTGFMDGLKGTLSMMFSPDEPFWMTNAAQKCGYCSYRGLCQR